MLKSALIITVILFMGRGVLAKVVSQPVEYRHGDTVLEGYLAYDDALEGRRPGVLVVHEWWGLNTYTKRRAEQLAELGYLAFAVDMYGKGITTDNPQRAGELAGQVRPILRDRARAGLDVLVNHDRVDRGRIAAIGYCFGGTTCLELAYGGTDLAGVVSFHGSLTTPRPQDAEPIKARILVLHGADDPLVPDAQIAEFQKAMKDSRADWQMIYYGQAVHSFSRPGADRAGIPGVAYDETADGRSWKHMQVFFDEIFQRRQEP